MESDFPLVSIVAVYNEADGLHGLHQDLRRVLDPLPFHFEFPFADDGSEDRTAEVLGELRARDPRVRFLSLSRNFGHQAALCAGLEHARGEAMVMMDGELQHRPAVIPP